MTLQELVESMARLLAEAEQRGFERAQAEIGSMNLPFLLGNALADGIEAMAARVGQGEAYFAEQLHALATLLREGVTPPAITGWDSAGGVVTVQFESPMDALSLPRALTVVPASGGPVLAGTVAYDARANAATFTPENGFTAGIEYKATLRATARTLRGVPLAGDATWNFTA